MLSKVRLGAPLYSRQVHEGLRHPWADDLSTRQKAAPFAAGSPLQTIPAVCALFLSFQEPFAAFLFSRFCTGEFETCRIQPVNQTTRC